MIDKYEDPFVRIASMIGGDEYLKVARSLLKAEDATDEEIASSTGLRINMVRKVLYDLFGKSLITGIRVKDERKGWFVYRWRTRREEVEHFCPFLWVLSSLMHLETPSQIVYLFGYDLKVLLMH